MSNIRVKFMRIFAEPGYRVSQREAEWITVYVTVGRDGNGSGTYYAPVHLRVGPEGNWVDIQYGSTKSDYSWEFWDRYRNGGRYRSLWVRSYDDGSDEDVIGDGPKLEGERFCRYGFDEVRVTTAGECPPIGPPEFWDRLSGSTFRATLSGSYRTGNNRTDMNAYRTGLLTPLTEPTDPWLATPTTPCCWGNQLFAIDPDWLEALAERHPDVVEMEYRWRGRVVHWARMEQTEYGPEWEHRNADDWDNCLDDRYIAATGTTELPLVSPAASHRDQQDWASRVRPWRPPVVSQDDV